MPKKIKNCYDKYLTFENLLYAYERAKKNKTYKNEVIKFEMNLEHNLFNIMNKLSNLSYRPGKFREFIIYEPKERVILALPFEDRVIHQWYIEFFIKPYICKRFIYSSCACIETKGTHFAADLAQKYMRICKAKYGSYYILKCDISKFFYNIDINTLINILSKKISDKKLITLSKIIYYGNNYDNIICGNYSNKVVGLPIGSYTSQYAANIYLNELDWYMKKLGAKFYVRYMDDFVLFLKDKDEAKFFLSKITSFVNEVLLLKLNPKTCYFKSNMGLEFCGYKIFETHKRIKKQSVVRMKRKIKNFNLVFKQGKLDICFALQSIASWKRPYKTCKLF